MVSYNCPLDMSLPLWLTPSPRRTWQYIELIHRHDIQRRVMSQVGIALRAGSRADERQKLLSLRSRALGWNFAMAAAFIGVTAGVAVEAIWWWPFLVILAVGGFGYLLGLSNYGVAEEGTADDTDAGHQVRSP